MNKFTTKLTALALLLAGGSQCAWAEDEDYEVLDNISSVTFLYDNDTSTQDGTDGNDAIYGNYCSYVYATKTFKTTFSSSGGGNNAVRFHLNSTVDISDYHYIVIEFAEAANVNFMPALSSSNDGDSFQYWGTEIKSPCGSGASIYAICLDTCAFKENTVGTVCFLTEWGWTDADLQFVSIRFTNFVEPIAEQEFDNAKECWMVDSLTWNADEGVIDYKGGNGNGAIQWLNDTYYDLTDYDSLIVKLAEASNAEFEIGVSHNGYLGVDSLVKYITISKDETEKVMDLTEDVSYSVTSDDGTKTYYTNTFHRDSINSIFIRTNYWLSSGTTQTIALSEVYLETSDGTKKYLWHKSGAYARKSGSGAYGTICLPYAAVADSATVYEVVGYGTNKSGDPSTLYLDAVDSLEAGVAYVFQSSANDSIVTFTLTGDSVGAATGNALVGTYSKEDVGDSYYILTTSTDDDGTVSYVWGKGTGNSVGAHKAYLNLSSSVFTESTTTSEAKANGWISMSLAYDGDDGTTGIKEIVSEEEDGEDDDAIYNLSGVRVTNPQKGIYIKNGKKYIIK